MLTFTYFSDLEEEEGPVLDILEELVEKIPVSKLRNILIRGDII